MEKYAAVLVGCISLGPCNDFPELDHSPSDISADTMAHVRFPIEMLIVACLCTCKTIKPPGTHSASKSALSGDVGGLYGWASGRRWSYSSRDRDIR